jgi:hypothetical protein
MGKGIILAMPLGGERHITVVYYGNEDDDGQVSAETLHALLRPVDSPQTATATVTAHFGSVDNGTAYVYLLDSPSLHAAHNQAKALSGTLADDRSPDYKPHVTIDYYATPEEAPPANEPIDATYVSDGLELWYDGIHYPLRDPFPSTTEQPVGAQWDPLRAGFQASGDFYHEELQRVIEAARQQVAKWTPTERQEEERRRQYLAERDLFWQEQRRRICLNPFPRNI